MTKAILLNGKPKCGKDTLLDHLQAKGMTFRRLECKDHLHDLTIKFFCIDGDRYWDIYNNRDIKETPLPEFRIEITSKESYYLKRTFGVDLLSNLEGRDLTTGKDNILNYNINMSIREAMIYVSECLCKPRFGKDYFGTARAANIKEDDIVIVDGSCGFVSEIKPLKDRIGEDNILLLRIHRDECNGSPDSRESIPDGILKNTVDIDNNRDLQSFLVGAENKIIKWLVKGEV